MLFPAVLMNFPNSEVCLIGEWSIVKCLRYSLQVVKEATMFSLYWFACKKLEGDSLISTQIAYLFIFIVVTYAWLVVLTLLGFLIANLVASPNFPLGHLIKQEKKIIVINIQVSQLPLHAASHTVPRYGLS